jgi:hypothetical protein
MAIIAIIVFIKSSNIPASDLRLHALNNSVPLRPREQLFGTHSNYSRIETGGGFRLSLIVAETGL